MIISIIEKRCFAAVTHGGDSGGSYLLAGLRDSASIRLMSDCLLRVSEAVAVDVEDLKDKTLIVKSSKTDQEGVGETLYVTSDTRRVINRYIAKAGIEGGALFHSVRRGDHVQAGRLTARSARRQITYWAELAGVEGFISGHSLRVGSAVSLAQAGASVVDMQARKKVGEQVSSRILSPVDGIFFFACDCRYYYFVGGGCL